MKLLVVTPTLGRSPWLAETVASVAASAGDCRHVLVAPAREVASLAARFPRVRVEAEPGGGMYAAINAGLAAVREWDACTYLNDDDLLLPAFASVRRAVSALDGRGPWLAYGGVRLIDAHGRRLGAIPISSTPASNRDLYAQRIEPVYQHGTVATRAVIDRLGGFDATLRFCGDSDFLARSSHAGIPFVCATRRETAAFRLRAGQLTKDRAAMIAERELVNARLGLLVSQPSLPQRLARWRFRLQNLGIYLERIRRHGFVSFDTMLTRLG